MAKAKKAKRRRSKTFRFKPGYYFIQIGDTPMEKENEGPFLLKTKEALQNKIDDLAGAGDFSSNRKALIYPVSARYLVKPTIQVTAVA